MNGWLVALSRAKEVVEVSLRRRRPGLGTLVTAAAPGCFALELCISAFGQVPQALNGPPVQVQPYVPEPGVPLLPINPGTPNPFSGADGAGANSGGDGNGGRDRR